MIRVHSQIAFLLNFLFDENSYFWADMNFYFGQVDEITNNKLLAASAGG